MTLQRNLLARPICISDSVGYAHGKLHRAPFFNTSALPPCGHRSKAAMGLMKKKNNQKLVLMREDNNCVCSAF